MHGNRSGRLLAALTALAVAGCGGGDGDGGGGGGGGGGGTTSYSISGTVTGAPAVTVTLTGAASATATTDGSGNYSFSGLANGSYTVTPSKLGYVFTPASAAVTVSGASVTGRDFTASPGTYAISGTVSGASAVTVTLSGASSATTTTDGSGNYSFGGLSGGSYTVAPSKTGFTFAPASAAVTVNGADVPNQNFAATAVTYAISGNVAGAAGVTVTLSGAATAATTTEGSGNYSFSGLANGNYTVTPSKTGYTFAPAAIPVTVSFANVTSQDFAARYSISGNVAGASAVTVTLSGASSATTTTDGSGNYAFGGLAPGSYTVTPSKTGATFAPASAAVTVSGDNVTGRNFSALHTISGIVDCAGTTLTLSGAASATTVNGQGGQYAFGGLANGTYTITPSRPGTTFVPASATLTVSGDSLSAPLFSARYSISGNVSGAASVTVTLSGAAAASTITDASGNYVFANLSIGNYVVTPSKLGYTFAPAAVSIPLSDSETGRDFAARYTISGQVTGTAGATVTLGGPSSASVISDGSGFFQFGGLANGTYTVTPTKTGYTFAPPSQTVVVSGDNGTPASPFVARYALSGAVTRTGSVTVTLSGAGAGSTTTGVGGAYSFGGLASGTYTVTPAKTGWTFSPASRSPTLSDNVTAQDFTAYSSWWDLMTWDQDVWAP